MKLRCLKVGEQLRVEVTEQGVGRIAQWSARSEPGSPFATIDVRLQLQVGDVIVIEPVGHRD